VNESVGRGGPQDGGGRETDAVRATNLERAGHPIPDGSPRGRTTRRDRPVAGSLRQTVWTERARNRPQRSRDMPGGGQAHEGRERRRTFTGPFDVRTRRGEQGPGPEGAHRWRGQPQPDASERAEGIGRGNPVRLRIEGQTPEGKSWTWQRGETNPQGR